MARARKPKALSPETYGGSPRPRHRFRMRFVFWGFLLAYAVVAGRLVQLHLAPDVKFSRQDLKHIAELPIPVPRGDILDTNGVVLATDKTVYSIWADPRAVVDPEDTAERLAAALRLDPKDLRGRLAKTDAQGNTKMFSWIRRWMAPEEIEALGNLQEAFGPGIHVRPEPLRFYPQADVAAHVIGFATLDRAGGEGIELTCDKYLSSKPGLRRSRADAKRNLLNSLTLDYREPEGGADVRLTIDAVIQQSLERELDKAMVEAKAPRALGMVMDPKTGAVLALACRPAYDPNRYWEYEAEERKNRAVVDVFEPGSAFKIVPAAAALERNLITPEWMVNCRNGSWNPYGHTIRDYHALPTVPFTEAFAQSSNIAIITVAALLGPEQLDEWIRRFGFGRKTSPEFIGESAGIYRSRKHWSRLSMGSLPMGQEISVTMPQLCRAFAAIANGGYLVDPYLIQSVVDRDGSYLYLHEPGEPEKILSDKTAKTMQYLCHLVVSTEHGTGRYAMIKEYRVGGKTGTAQIAKPGVGYLPGKFTAVFAGFAPVSDPKLCAVIVVEEPGIRLHYGGYICGPIFKKVVREALIRMGCPPDPMAEPDGSKPFEEPSPEEDPDAVVVAAGDPDGGTLSESDLLAPLEGLELVALAGDSTEGPVLPDLRHMSKAAAISRISSLGIPGDFQGAGWVVKQEPPPGTPLSQVALCRLVFSNARTDKPDTSDNR
jgi:cell division protein FtsI/penicillin-binding protein 2